MTQTQPPKRNSPSSNTTGVKILVATASVTAVVGGWAAYTVQQSQPVDQNVANKPDGATDQATQGTLDLPPIPTLVPEVSSRVAVSAQTGLPVAVAPLGTSPLVASPLVTPAINVPLATPGVIVTQPGTGKAPNGQGNGSGKTGQKPPKPPKPPKPSSGSGGGGGGSSGKTKSSH